MPDDRDSLSALHEASVQYASALKRGKKTQKDRLQQGLDPGPPALDDLLRGRPLAGMVELGLMDIPMEDIAGTRTRGRQSAFAADFMPLMEPYSEFAAKWIHLCADHLGEAGIRDPIRCFEYLGKFYVQEGNKRVSVLKSFDAPTISAYVVRQLPARTGEAEIEAYYDFLYGWERSKLYSLVFSSGDGFPKLQAALGFEPDHVWTEDERRHFSACFSLFRKVFSGFGGRAPGVLPADALLVCLKVYPYEQLSRMSENELTAALRSVQKDVQLSAVEDPVQLAVEVPEKSAGVLGRLVKSVFPDHITAAFIDASTPGESDWSRSHDLGRQYLEAVMDEKVSTLVFSGASDEAAADAAMEEAVGAGAQVVFANAPSLIGACRRAAAKHPSVRVLNCSASMPYAGVRTYYSRIYEAKFITGAIAGALSNGGTIGYVAGSPTLGVPASINAFALGVQLTAPEARVRLRWSGTEEDPLGALRADGAVLISNRDVPSPDRMDENWGLVRALEDGFRTVASPYWHWGNVYVRLVRSILDGSWDALGSGGPHAVNYWWGMRSRAVDVLFREDLPLGTLQLAELLRRNIAEGTLLPFERRIRSQDGALRSDGSHWFSPAEILRMDWLCDSVDGSIPEFDELLPMARPLVRLLGVHRERIAPEKEEILL